MSEWKKCVISDRVLHCKCFRKCLENIVLMIVLDRPL